MKGIYIKVPEGMLELWKESSIARKITLSQLIREAVNRDIERTIDDLRIRVEAAETRVGFLVAEAHGWQPRLEAAEDRAARYAKLLERLSHWDHLDGAADGQYWKSEIAAFLAEQ